MQSLLEGPVVNSRLYRRTYEKMLLPLIEMYSCYKYCSFLCVIEKNILFY